MKNPEQFIQWWSDIEADLHGFARSVVGYESKDVVQEVSLLAMMRFDDFDSIESFRRWAMIRVRWLVLDVLARQQKSAKGSQDIVEALSDSVEDDAREWLVELISRLPDQQRRVVEQRLMGYTSSEIAQKFEIAESTVRSSWRHAKNNLVRLASEESEGSEQTN